MSFRSLTAQHEQLPWSWPLRLGASIPMLRSRSIITAIDSEGRKHQAELAPCPGVHPESMAEALASWQKTIEPILLRAPLSLHDWQWTSPYFGLLDAPPLPFRSVQTATEQLLLSWAQSQHPEEFSLPAPMSLEGSALLAIQADEEASWKEFLQLWNQGFRIFKCKVGRHPAAHEYAFLQKLANHGKSQIQLRLDANQGMDDEDLDFWKNYSQDLPIVYWEEAAGFPTLALDETLWDEDKPFPQAQAWILKPTRLGLSRTVCLLKKAAEENILCVLSNAFDAGLTLRCSAWLYAAFCQKPQALGFGTSRFLPDDPWQSHAWAAPRVTIQRYPFAMQEEA